MADFPSVNEQMDVIRADAVEVVPEEELVRKLERSAEAGEPLTVKQGFDPTRPDLHIGHAVSLRKLRDLQELGHRVVFVVGDYTARVGDPSGRSETRPRLSPDEIRENARSYAEQVDRILDIERAEVECNSSWLEPLTLAEVLELTATYTVARLLERDDFRRRHEAGSPISILEFMYPLLQAYDSVALEADIEVGGTDQKFNLLVGRTVQERYGQEPQVCLILPLMRGTDGEAKMSKSYDNYIGLTEEPAEQFGKAMSIPDELLDEWIELAGVYGPDERATVARRAGDEPYAVKRELARRVVRRYHGEEAARAAEARFDRIHREGGAPADTPSVRVDPSDPDLRVEDGEVWLPRLLSAAGLTESNSEGVRLIEQGAIAVDGETVGDRNRRLPARGSVLLRRGKRRFAKVRFDGDGEETP